MSLVFSSFHGYDSHTVALNLLIVTYLFENLINSK